ncbi:hypothetical protein [Nostoc sp. FACHB-190]|uniref:hypothetical protein n=1 Tax=Nostoc sp. FACHB-190 TaxID=2692838 RepID=UPI00168234E8|nr:hypothetical protein [Nostoc sp. FACHB-190]MBD2301740.1 hypothetical protein [Nostoc sp. FACHB-190]
MSKKRTVELLFKVPSDIPNKSEALLWAKAYGNNFPLAVSECPRGDWLIWMMTRSKAKPKPLVWITHQCITSAIDLLNNYGDLPFERGFYTVEKWLSEKTTLENCQDALDDLSTIVETEELSLNEPLNIASHSIFHLLTAIVDISEGTSKSDVAYSLAWTIYLAAILQSTEDEESLEQVLMQYANFIRQFLKGIDLNRLWNS